MSLALVKNGTSDEYSYGVDTSDPVTIADVTLDDTGSPATVSSTVLTTQLRATTWQYTGIAIAVNGEETGEDWKLSLDNTNWFDELTSGTGGDSAGQIADIDARSATQTKTVYFKKVVANDGSVSSGQKTTPVVELSYTELQ
jgi:hypothetical protein